MGNGKREKGWNGTRDKASDKGRLAAKLLSYRA